MQEAEDWFEAIDCDDEEYVKILASRNPGLLDRFYEEAEYPEDLKDLAVELLGKQIGPLTPIEYACFVESEDSALVLVDLSSDLQLSHKWGANNTVFHLAAFNGLERVLRKLLRRQLPSTGKNKSGFRPVDCVANDATRDVFANFIDEENLEESTPLIESKPKKMVDKTDLPKFSDSKEDLSLDDDSEYEIPEYPPLRKINPNAIPKKSALKMSATKNKKKINFEDQTILFDACRNGELDLVKELIQKKKMSTKSKTFLGITLVHMAVESGNVDLVKFLVENGGDLTAIDADGWSPLHLAASANALPIVQYLVEKGANVNLPTKDGEYAIEFTESEELKNFIQSSKGFDKKILEVVANRPKIEKDEDGKSRKRD